MNQDQLARIAARIAARNELGMSAEEYNAHERRLEVEKQVAQHDAIQRQLCDFINDGFIRRGSTTRCKIVRGKAMIPFAG
jgi:hypothetical protein